MLECRKHKTILCGRHYKRWKTSNLKSQVLPCAPILAPA